MIIVFDIGGTNMRVAGALNGKLGEVKKVPTPQGFDETIATLASIAKEIAGAEIECVAGCIAAQIDPVRGLYDANNRKQWEGRHFDTELSEALHAPVRVGNDCPVIGLGELHFGAGKGARRLAYVTVSTGVGAGLVVDGAIASTPGFHFGHEVISGEELEGQISGTAVKKKFGIEPKDLESLEERNKLADTLAAGLMKIIEVWQPDTVVLGGSMITGVNPIPIDRVHASLTRRGEDVALRMAALGDVGGLYGGMILASAKESEKNEV